MGRGSFVLIECFGFLVVTTATVSLRHHAFFFFRKIVCLVIESMIRRPMDERTEIQSRRYIGSKAKLIPWIFDTIRNETAGVKSFCDIFAGTGVVANEAIKRYEKVVVNDLLYSNNVIYNAFWGKGRVNGKKLLSLLGEYNSLDPSKLKPNYFSVNFGGKFFDELEAKRIGFVRENIEQRKEDLSTKEYNILLASLIYGMDKIANTLGHYEAYIHKPIQHRSLILKPIKYESNKNVTIHMGDANLLARKISTDLVYIDPPYNSRQYSRFYHVYETLVKWNKPKLAGTAMKPPLENMSEYCSARARDAMQDLIKNLKTKYIVVSYNNTYHSKSSSSENKIRLEEIQEILDSVGKTKIFEHSHQFFNAGKTEFKDHKELLFVTEVR